MTPPLATEQMDQFSGLVAQYVTAQRERYRSRGLRLAADQMKALEGFFPLDLLANARLLVLHEERVANPDFYPALRALGFVNLPDQSGMGAITFIDTIVSHEPFTNGLLFHELVHVEQYRQLGVSRFSDCYVRGFLNGGGYEWIPLERNAYALGERFEKNPGVRFSVSEEVETGVKADRF